MTKELLYLWSDVDTFLSAQSMSNAQERYELEEYAFLQSDPATPAGTGYQVRLVARYAVVGFLNKINRADLIDVFDKQVKPVNSRQ